MAKHDQRILKFLNQNADRAPTITEMMTRLNISISDISDSLGSLQSQGLISKKTNGQGIECWFPAGPQAISPAAPMAQAAPQHLATQPLPIMGNPMASAPSASENRAGVESRFGNGLSERFSERPFPAPEPQPPLPKQPPVQVQHIPMEEPVPAAESVQDRLPPQPASALNASAPLYGLSQPASRGIGVLTLLVGLAAAVGLSTWLGGRMAAKEIRKASKDFVDRKSLTEANAAFTEFQEKTKAHVTALETEVKHLTESLAATKAAAETLKTTAAKPEPAKAEPVAKGKAGKRSQALAAKTRSSGSTAMAKAAARGAAKKRKTAARAPARSNSEYSSSEESGNTESPSENPGMPPAPGLDDLPPPPSE